MKNICLTSVLVVFVTAAAIAQSPDKLIRKSWIKTNIENLSSRPVAPDTAYMRYTFDKTMAYISFDRAWDTYSMQWTLTGRYLTIGFETYRLEEVTDSTLVFSKNDFRRFRFISEDRFCKLQQPDTATGLDGQPVYISSDYLTPRYKRGGEDLRSTINASLEKVQNVKRKNTFRARFVVTSQGKVERVVIEKGISGAYDKEFINQITKTSGRWYSAKVNGVPVHCEINFETQYLDSIVPY